MTTTRSSARRTRPRRRRADAQDKLALVRGYGGSKRTKLGASGTAKLSLNPKRVKRGAQLTARVTVTVADGAAATLQRTVRISR